MKPGDKVKVTCTNPDQNTWVVDSSGSVEAVCSFVQPDGTAYLVNTDRAHDFAITVAPTKAKEEEENA